MKKIFFVLLMTIMTFNFSGCKKFLNVDPIDDLSGNNFWKQESDVESFAWGLYWKFRNYTMGHFYFPAVGDFRMAWINRGNTSDSRTYINHLRINNIKGLLNPSTSYYANDFTNYFLGRNTQWDSFYDIIQMANILEFEINRLEDGILSEGQKKQYKAEASFMRNLCYFFMVRMYGDVPYIREAYDTAPKSRENMVQVLRYCIEDMGSFKNDLPWRYNDASIVGIRAMRGAAIALMMHMELWAASFDKGDKRPYYERVESLGSEIMEGSGHVYKLLPIENFKEIFLGKSNESLFELPQSLNYGERFGNIASFPNQVLKAPLKPTILKSFTYYDRSYLNMLYPTGTIDKRFSYWFTPETVYATNGDFIFLKFSNFFATGSEDVTPDDSQIIFRYPDAILLRAEALAELGRASEAKEYLELVRGRAGLIPKDYSDLNALKEEIFLERNREFMGEGHYFFDLVRTRRVLDSKYVPSPINVEDFERGAWTWPIHSNALKNNPLISLNLFWL